MPVSSGPVSASRMVAEGAKSRAKNPRHMALKQGFGMKMGPSVTPIRPDLCGMVKGLSTSICGKAPIQYTFLLAQSLGFVPCSTQSQEICRDSEDIDILPLVVPHCDLEESGNRAWRTNAHIPVLLLKPCTMLYRRGLSIT